MTVNNGSKYAYSVTADLVSFEVDFWCERKLIFAGFPFRSYFYIDIFFRW